MIERKPNHPFIAELPGVNGGYPVVAPTRIAVRLVIEAYRELGDLDETAEVFPQLSREQIQAALDFYRDQPSRVDDDIARNEQALKTIRSR